MSFSSRSLNPDYAREAPDSFMKITFLLLASTFLAHAQPPVADAGARQPPRGPRRDGPPGGFGPGMEQKQEIQKRFDTDDSGMLEENERKAALAELEKSGGGRRMGGPDGRRRPGGRGETRAEARPGERVSPADVEVYRGAALYEPGTLRTLFLEFDTDEWESQMAAFKRTDVEMPAKLTVDGKELGTIGVRFRGASSFMMVPEGYKRSLNLSINFPKKKKRLGGYRTLNLLNAANDPGFLNAPIYSHIARQFIPAPNANYVRVVINGENWGVYISQQQFNKDFLRDFFDTTKGRRWHVPGSPRGRGSLNHLGDDAEAYRKIYEIKSKDEPEAWDALVRLTKTLDTSSAEELEKDLPAILDVDGALKFLALEIALMNSDGYWTRTSDYSLYQDTDGRFHIVPHDMNEAFRAGHGGPGGRKGPGGRGGPGEARRPRGSGSGFTLDPLVGADDPGKPLISKLLAVPAWRERYLGYVREIANTWLDWGRLGPIAEGFQKTIAEDVRKDTRKLDSYEDFTAAREQLRSFAEGRRRFLLEHPAIRALESGKTADR